MYGTSLTSALMTLLPLRSTRPPTATKSPSASPSPRMTIFPPAATASPCNLPSISMLPQTVTTSPFTSPRTTTEQSTQTSVCTVLSFSTTTSRRYRVLPLDSSCPCDGTACGYPASAQMHINTATEEDIRHNPILIGHLRWKASVARPVLTFPSASD